MKRQSEPFGFTTISESLSKAEKLLSEGRYSIAVSQVNSTLSLIPQWQASVEAYRSLDSILSSQADSTGIQTIKDCLDKGKVLLLQGDYSQSLAQIDATRVLFSKWQGALQSLRSAENAVTQARDEGRTWQLEKPEVMLGQAQELIAGGQFDASTSKSKVVYEASISNMTPFRALLPCLAAFIIAIGLVMAGIFIIRKRRTLVK